MNEREEFEKWAEESFGGKISVELDRDSQFPDDYKYADVHMAWKAWQYRAELGERSATTK